MKGFKPTGFGPSAGFKYPSSMGFTGSTGTVTNVSPYVRRKGFADGGFVRQDNPRMKEESVGDQGSALIRRARSTNNLDQESGGKTPVRPGYRKGGRSKKMCKAAGGEVKRSNAKGFWASVADIPALAKELARMPADSIKRKMYSGQRTVEGRNESVDEYAGNTSRFARGGKAKRMSGGPARMMADAIPAPGRGGSRFAPPPQMAMAPPPAMKRGSAPPSKYPHYVPPAPPPQAGPGMRIPVRPGLGTAMAKGGASKKRC